MSLGYLDALDTLLRAGVSHLSRGFMDLQARFVEDNRLAGGGFRGRRGGEDLYYTDFGVRLLSLLGSQSKANVRSQDYLAGVKEPDSVLDCFSMLNIARMLGRRDLLDSPALLKKLQAQQLAGGGFARPGGAEPSAYTTFLAALCFEMLDMDFPEAGAAVAAVSALRRPDGGYSELPEHTASQTNATAAAVAFLTMQNSLDEEATRSAVRFLTGIQSSDGGILAQPSAPRGDLLSTFTGCLTLFGLDELGKIDTAAVARFVGELAHPGGGFRSCLPDDGPDIEYTYYGLGTLALLRVFLNRESTKEGNR